MLRRGPVRAPLGAALLVAGAASLALALSGCGEVKDTDSNVVNGKKLFVAKCGSCHELRRAGTKGVTGPNLDEAFRQSLQDGMTRKTVEGVVGKQILNPATGGAMPAKIYTGDDADDVAAYVALVAAKPGEDKGALAAAVPQQQASGPAVAKGGVLEIDTDPTGQLKYVVDAASSGPGKLTIKSQNKSQVDHNIALEGPGVQEAGEVVKGGATSQIEVTVKPGSYTFFCSVPGHREAGMQGKLTVK